MFGHGRPSVADRVPGEQGQTGALQRFVPDVLGSSDDFGMPRDLSAAASVVPIAAIQHIASLDIQLCNTDRHPGNLLLQRRVPVRGAEGGPRSFVPVPIDHGCVLPYWWAMGEACFDAWSSWSQVRAPCEPEVLRAIVAAFDRRDEAARMLARAGLEPAALATHRLALSLLRHCTVQHGLCLAAVAALMCRQPACPEEPSWLESQMAQCASAAGIPWQWTQNAFGDRVPAEPADPMGWPPGELVGRLEERFASEATLIAGRQQECGTGSMAR